MPALKDLMVSDPDEFLRDITTRDEGLSLDFAKHLDEIDPLHLHDLFEIGAVTPFAGHSLGPVFKPAKDEIQRILRLQSSRLHEGHFSSSKKDGGNWFEYDVDEEALAAMQAMLGFADFSEFIYTQEGLSANLGRVLDTFYRPSAKDWQTGKVSICYLGKEFFSDQAVIDSVLKRGIETATGFEVFDSAATPTSESLALKILPDERGLYSEEAIIAFIRTHADKIKILHLSDVVFSTGQRLDISRILEELKDVLAAHQILVGLDLAHTVGNRPINLSALPVTYAVGCSYKHICGSAGSGFGIYINKDTDLKRYPPIKGWKAAAPDRVFGVIDGFAPALMADKGAAAFRCSNPSPVAIAPVRQYMKTMSAIGWDKLVAKSECLTRYMLALLRKQLGDKMELITPENPKQRGAMLVFRIKGLADVNSIEELLKRESALGQFEIDTRPPNNIRITAHYGYTRFTDIQNMVMRLKQVVEHVLALERGEEHTLLAGGQRFFAVGAVAAAHGAAVVPGSSIPLPGCNGVDYII